METLSNAGQLLWDFKELGNREECHIVCRLDAGHFAWRHTLTHSWPFTPSLNAKEQMLCNFLFSTETIASTPFLTRPLSLQPSTTDPWQANMYQGLSLSLSLSLSHTHTELSGHTRHKIQFKSNKLSKTICLWCNTQRFKILQWWECFQNFVVFLGGGVHICPNNELM